jgi:small subunit ribosomal protein S4
MSRFTGAKNRIARRFGTNIFGRLRNPLLHKPNPPGQHGARRKKKSDYGQQLEEQQKLRASFGMLSKKQLLKYYQTALKMQQGTTAHNFLELLELRLDIAVFRLKLAHTIFQAQQLVTHGHILVDGKKVDIRSFQVRPGMTISVKEKSQKLNTIKDAVEGVREVPSYYSFDPKKLSGQLVTRPELDQIPIVSINVPLVCEFLAHTS